MRLSSLNSTPVLQTPVFPEFFQSWDCSFDKMHTTFAEFLFFCFLEKHCLKVNQSEISSSIVWNRLPIMGDLEEAVRVRATEQWQGCSRSRRCCWFAEVKRKCDTVLLETHFFYTTMHIMSRSFLLNPKSSEYAQEGSCIFKWKPALVSNTNYMIFHSFADTYKTQRGFI